MTCILPDAPKHTLHKDSLEIIYKEQDDDLVCSSK